MSLSQQTAKYAKKVQTYWDYQRHSRHYALSLSSPSPFELKFVTNDNLLIQCISSTVPLVIVVRFLPQAIQTDFPRDGWYMPSGQKEHVLFFVLYEPAGQSAEGAPDKEKNVILMVPLTQSIKSKFLLCTLVGKEAIEV